MSESLRSMKEVLLTLDNKRLETIKRRISEKKGGLGYWAAVDAAKKLGLIK